jgi:hypothetical protein
VIAAAGQPSFWTSLPQQVLIQLISDIVLIIFFILLVTLLSDALWRRGLRRFFRTRRARSGAISIFLSNMYVKQRGTLNVNQSTPVTRGYFGYTITEAEYFYSLRLASSIQASPLSRLVRGVAEQLGATTVSPPVVCDIKPAPRYVIEEKGELSIKIPLAEITGILSGTGTVICVGAPMYNVVTDHVLEHAGPARHFEFVRPPNPAGGFGNGIRIHDYHANGEPRDFLREQVVFPGAPDDQGWREYFVLQRMLENQPSTSAVFICAGTSTAATVAALEEMSNWRALGREFGESAFALLFELVCPTSEMNSDDRSSSESRVHRIWSSLPNDRKGR